MSDREKVIKGLECCCAHIVGMGCGNCPYEIEQREVGDISDCTTMLTYDALALLKRQNKTPVVFSQRDGLFATSCGNCGWDLDKTYSICPKCQRELDWNALQE